MKIGDLARVTQCTVETVRYYESVGLLPEPTRTSANYRDYGDVHVERLRFIRNCRALDMTHEEIRVLLAVIDNAESDCSGVNDLVDDHIHHVEVRISELTDLKQQLVTLRARCTEAQTGEVCGIIRELTTKEADPKQDRHTHLG